MPASADDRELRKIVTVLFCDLTGSTAIGESIDAERLRSLMARYFDRMKAIIERHGGTVEKFIGDAVMAVFGIPVAHEDDALRAVRAAAEMQEALPELGLVGRIGVLTGEVVTGTQERLATGDVVNVASRLEHAAPPGQVLIGLPTLTLVEGAVEVEALEPLAVKGKADPVPAFRLVRVHDAPERRHGAAFVGRARELARLTDAWDRVRADRRCELFTIVGDAGVGKSRLAAEFLGAVGATVLRGRCLPYGDGITYWPVVEVVKQAGLRPADEAVATAIGSLMGETDAPTSSDEIAWAFRKLLEQAASEEPLVVVFDDIHWGEEAFLDLVEHVALFSSDAAILTLCMARKELSERRASWPVTLPLEPLGDEAVDALIPDALPGPLRGRIARAAGGNPLFVEEMVAMAGESDGEVVVPPTLHALLAARLDQLGPDERSVLERAAIEGEVFHLGAVRALGPEASQVTPQLAALVRKGMIRPDRSAIAGDDGFRFRHLLVRDVVYEALPKSRRADLHERLASWLDGTELVERDELIGYHLAQACDYRAELGEPNERLAAEARRRLVAGGHRASARQDFAAATSLFERAAEVEPVAELGLAADVDFDDALIWTGRADEALRRADASAASAAVAGDRVLELCARLRAGVIAIGSGREGVIDRSMALVTEALPVFSAAGDDRALYLAYSVLGEVESTRARMDAALSAVERAFGHARRLGRIPAGLLGSRAAFRFFGSTSVSDILAWLDEQEAEARWDQFLRAYRAAALAMLGRFDEARTMHESSRRAAAERGGGVLLANLTAFESVDLELWAGDPAAAAAFAAEGFRLHEELGDHNFLSEAAASQARALYALDRLDDAERWSRRSEELGSSDRVISEMIWRRVRAKVLARRGEHDQAERLAREAVAISEAAEVLDAQADTWADLAEVLALAGRTADASEAFREALARYERKGNVVMSERVRARRNELGGAGR